MLPEELRSELYEEAKRPKSIKLPANRAYHTGLIKGASMCQTYFENKVREAAIAFLDSIRAYEHENGRAICYDERESSELYDIFLLKP